MFVINVRGNIISVQETEPITSGSINIYRCRFAFDDSWEGFFRSAVFRVGPMIRTVPLDADDMCELPWELLVKKNIGLPVEVSVYGSKDETEILPTIWDKMGRVRSGSEPGEDVKDPTPTVYNQLTNLVRIYSDKVTAESEAAAESAKEANFSAQDAHAYAQTATAAVSGINASVAAAAVSAAAAKESETKATQSASAAQESESKVLAAASEVAANAASAQQSAERAAASEEVAKSAIASAEEAKEAATVAAAQALVAYDAATASTNAAASAVQSESNALTSAESASASAAAAEEWSKKAEQAAGGGVLSFKGRNGEVTPQSGDYTAEMVGADASGAAASALTDAKAYTDAKIAAIPAPDVSGQIATHNSSSSAHSDIRGAIPTKVSQLTNDKGYITGYTESDPTVPAWAKAASKPSYTASEVGAAASSHNHSASNITSGTLAVARGGTGITANPSMLVNLGSTSAASVFAASPRPGVTGTLPVARGGTGATTAAAARTNLGAAPTIKYGTSDVTAGAASSYAEGTLYVVIE